MTYPLSFRQKVLSVKARHKLTFLEVSKRFEMGIHTVVRWSKKIEPQKTHKVSQPLKSRWKLLEGMGSYILMPTNKSELSV